MHGTVFSAFRRLNRRVLIDSLENRFQWGLDPPPATRSISSHFSRVDPRPGTRSAAGDSIDPVTDGDWQTDCSRYDSWSSTKLSRWTPDFYSLDGSGWGC